MTLVYQRDRSWWASRSGTRPTRYHLKSEGSVTAACSSRIMLDVDYPIDLEHATDRLRCRRCFPDKSN